MSGALKKKLDWPILQFALAAVLVTSALLTRQILVLRYGLELPAFILFYPVVMFAALFSGLWVGLWATALSTLLAAIWVFPPIGQIRIEKTSDLIALLLFFAMGVFMSVVAEHYRRNQRNLALVLQELALRKANDELEEIGEYRRLALEAAELGAWEYQLEAGEVVWDDCCRNGFGINLGERITYEAALERIHPEDRAATDEALKQAIAGADGGAYHQEFRVVWPDGSLHWISSHGRVYFSGSDDQRQAFRFIGVNTDITERQQAEQALRESRAKLEAALASMTDAVFICDAGMRFVEFNDAFARFHKFKSKAECPATFAEYPLFLQLLTANGEPVPLEQWSIPRALRGETAANVEFTVCRKDTGEIWIGSYSFSPIRDADGSITGAVVTARDITERKRAESRLRRFYETDLFAILYWKIDGEVDHVNDRFLEMTGYTREDVSAGLMNWAAMTPPEYQALDEDARRQIVETGVHQPYEKEFIRKDGRRVWGQFWAAAYDDDRTQGVSFILDITERKRAEEALQESESRYRNLFNAMTEGFCIIEVLFDADGKPEDYRFLEVNAAFEAQTGLHDAVGKRMRSLAPAHEEHWFQIYGKIALTGEPSHFMNEARALNRYYDVHAYRVGEPELRRVAIVFNDISDYKRAEQALRESEARFRSVLDNSRDVIYRLNVQTGFYEYISPSVAAAVGFSPGELMAMDYETSHGLIHPDDLAAFEAFATRLEGSGEGEQEYRQLDKNGGYRWLSNRASLIKDQAGLPLYRNGNIRDITDRKRTEEALRESREWLRVTLSSIGDAVLTTDTEGRITFLNPVASALTGWQPGDAEGRPIHTVFRVITEGTRATADDVVKRVLKERRIVELANHSVLLAADGREIPVEDSAAPILDSNGQIAGVVLVFHDVSEKRLAQEALRKSEEQFRNLANAIPQLCWMAKADGYIFWYNQRWYEYTGTTPAEMEGWGWQSVHDPEALPYVLERWQASVATGQPFDMVFPLLGADGVFRPFLTRVMPLKDADGRVLRWFGTNTDITERQQAEEQLQILNRTLKALSNSNQALLHATDEAAFLDDVCRVVIEDCGYAMVWIGLAEDDERKTVRPVAWSGFDEGYLPSLNITWDLSEHGRGPTGTAIRTGQPSMCRNMLTDPDFAPWRQEAVKRGYASSLVVPLKDGNRAIGAITIYSRKPEAFSEGEVSLLTELAGDLAFGIRTLRERAAYALAAEDLRASEEQLGLFIEHAPAALAMFDNNMRYLRASRRWKTDFALGERSLRGRSHYDVFPEISQEWREYHRRGLTGEVLRKEADRFERADGSVQWIRWELRPWNDREGNIGGILIFNEEITGRKLAEDALRDQAELIDLAHDTIMVFDLDGTIHFWNHGAEEMYGFTREQAIGRKSHKLLSTVFPQPLDEIMTVVLRDGRWEGELAHVTRAGTGIMVDSRWALQRDKDGQPSGIMEINNDITARVRAEEAEHQAHRGLQFVLDSITDGLLVLDKNWRYTYFSEHGAHILGLRPEDLVGGSVWDLFPQAENSKFGEMYKQAVKTHRPVHFEEFCPEPLNMWLECHCYPSEDGLSVYFRDISERKRAEEALLRSEKLASVGRMAATIAHEINNPLAAITNTLFLARMKADDPASVREFIDLADDELKRIAHITRQTLGFYRESSSPTVVAVHEVLESALDLMKSKIAAKQAIILKEWDGSVEVCAIAGELRQVFSNLINNSLDAIDEGGMLKLRVSLGPGLKGAQHSVRVTVADNGKGISAISKAHIFEPFYTTKGTVGTGLGLWVSKQIIDKHSGAMHVRSCTNGAHRGTAFTVVLPAGLGPIVPLQSR